MTPLIQTAREIFVWAKSRLAGKCELEIFLTQGRGRSILWSEKKCEEMTQAEGGGVGIRTIQPSNGSNDGVRMGKQGFAFTTSFSQEPIEKTAERAFDTARILPAEAFRKLPVRSNSAALQTAAPNENLFDPSTFSESAAAIMERLKAGENKLLQKYPLLKSILRAGFSEGSSEVAIINSNGIEEIFSGTHCGLGVSCLAEKEGERQEGGFGQSKRFKKDLDWELAFEKSAERTMALLGGKPIPSGTIPVIFDPSVACEFLSLISGAVCADSVQRGKSFLAGKLGEIVASKKITLVDDGTLPKGVATSPVDDEGVPTQKTVVISDGKLNHYLYDTYTALKDKTVSTGNASRAGFKSSPSPGPSNFYLCAGDASREHLLKETTGLYLYEVMGLHMADPISGDFSVGAIGAWLENGEFKHGVRGITLAGNLLELLKNIDLVCDDLTFFGSVGSPSFKVSHLMVSGQ